MVRLYIIRHADPDYDTNRSFGGSITEHGKKEATALATYLAKEEITHAYSSPLGRARTTAKIALAQIPKFSGDYNFELFCGIEDWSRELTTWRVREINGSIQSGKGMAMWDFPASITRDRLVDITNGTGMSTPGWLQSCPDQSEYYTQYCDFCKESDNFLSRHGIHRYGANYYMTEQDAANHEKRSARISVFCHGGQGLTWLAHLLSIPFPMVHSSFWLPPSSVTTILFDESGTKFASLRDGVKDGSIILTPRALCVGGTSHLAVSGLETANSKYENWKRPSGIKQNFW